MRHKIFYFSIISLFITQFSFSQVPESELKTADSLFLNKKFTQSLKIYEKLTAEGYYTDALLLKMAYIYEGLEDYPKSLYYLSELNKLSPNEALDSKIKTLAINNGLDGYDTSDEETFNKVNAIFFRILSIVILIALAVLAVYYIILKNTSKSILWSFFICSVLWALINFIDTTTKNAIIWKEHTYLMQSPAASSDVIDIIPRGTRFLVEDENELWVKLIDGENEYYVKRENVKFI